MLFALTVPSLRDLVVVVVVLAILGVAFGFAKPYIAEPFQKMIIAIAVIFLVLYLLVFFGLL